MKLNKRGLALREIVIAIIALIILGIIIYIAFGPALREAVSALFNKTEIAEKAVEKGVGEISSKFLLKIFK